MQKYNWIFIRSAQCGTGDCMLEQRKTEDFMISVQGMFCHGGKSPVPSRDPDLSAF